MRLNLPTDLLRSFVAIVDTGSMVRASERVFLTQSALSLQMKRLADIVQQPIFRRYHGATSLTPAGETLLQSAREILALNDQVVSKLGGRLTLPTRIGMVQDFADAILSDVLAQLTRLSPHLQLEIRIASSAELQELISVDLLDIALYFGDQDDESAISVANLEWLGKADILARPVLPVAMMGKPCLFRDAAMESLENSGRDFNIVVETPSMSVLRAAVESGHAITCRTPAFLGERWTPLTISDLALPQISYKLSIRPDPHPTVELLADLIREAVTNI